MDTNPTAGFIMLPVRVQPSQKAALLSTPRRRTLYEVLGFLYCRMLALVEFGASPMPM